jgi:hypothetical protein
MKLNYNDLAKISYQSYCYFLKGLGEENIPDWELVNQDYKKELEDMVRYINKTSIYTEQDIHNYRKKYKFNNGWTYGEELNLKEKKDPILKDWDELNELEIIEILFMVNTIRSLNTYLYWDITQ